MREHRTQLDHWEQSSLLDIAGPQRSAGVRTRPGSGGWRIAGHAGEPLLRVLAVLEGAA